MTDEQIDAIATAQPNKCVTANLTADQYRTFARALLSASKPAATVQSVEPVGDIEIASDGNWDFKPNMKMVVALKRPLFGGSFKLPLYAAPQPSRPVESGGHAIAGLGRMTDEDNGFVTLQFVDEESAQQFMTSYAPTVEDDEMPKSAVVLDDERAAFGECIRLLESCLLNFNWPELRVAMESAIKSARKALASHDARAASPQATVCATCNGHSMIGGPSYYAPDEGGEPCPDCATAAQPAQTGESS